MNSCTISRNPFLKLLYLHKLPVISVSTDSPFQSLSHDLDHVLVYKGQKTEKENIKIICVGPTVLELQLLSVERKVSLLLHFVLVRSLNCHGYHDDRVASGLGKERLEKREGGGQILHFLSIRSSLCYSQISVR